MLYVFLDCELDTHLHTLRRAGKTTRLRPKVFQFLQHLIEQRERVVSKHELIERFWPKPFVSDAAVEGTIRDVRRAVGDSRNSQHIIQTLPGHGYRFIAHLSGSFEVRERPGEPQQAEASGPSAAVTGSATEAVGAGADGWTCAVCYHVMPPGYSQDVRFCLACGAELGSLCLDCGFRNQPRARFCVACGSPLADALPSGEASPTSRTGAVAEQRQLTVLSCELVGALRLSQRLGLEAYREVIRAYRAVCAEVIGRYEGYRAPYLSDGGVLAYFGWPQAHDDDAQRAVRAGLGLVDALGALNDRLAREHDTTVALRVGIHTGPVVVEDVPDGESSGPLALGEPPYVATQLRDLAAPNTVVMSTDTAELVQGYFVWQEVAPHAVEGRAEPVGVVRVLRPSGAQSRLDTAGPRGLTPLVGRETEVPLLLERWSRVMEGAGQAVLLSGEAGIGKSRLAQVVKDHVPDTAALQLECRCSPYDQHSALYPVITLVHQLLAWDDLDTPAEKLKRLETVLTRCALPLGEMVPLLAALLSLPVDAERYPPPLLSRQQQRQQTLHAILALVLALAAEQPVVLIVEDLHWIDPSTLEWLSLLVEQLPTVPVYALFTYRPVFRAPWGPRSYVTPVVLQRLPREQVALMVTRVTGGKPVPDEVLRQIVAKTDGVPLFVEELTKAVLELGLLRDIDDRYELTASLPDLAIPVTLHDSLMARLDRLGLAKGVAQLGATLGRQFSAALLQARDGRVALPKRRATTD
jgi:class 3 adenylate cyclase/DNA-binding winged helix-turn-helix (wHTH) protein